MRLALLVTGCAVLGGPGCALLFDSAQSAASSHPCSMDFVNLSFDDDDISPLTVIGDAPLIRDGRMFLRDQESVESPALGTTLGSENRGEVVATVEIREAGSFRVLLIGSVSGTIGGFGVESGKLITHGGQGGEITSFDSTAHRVLRFRVIGQQLFIEGGPEIADLALLRQEDAGAWGPGEKITVRVDSLSGSTELNSLRVQAVPFGDWCNASELVDDFSDRSARPLWFESSIGTPTSTEDEGLEVTVRANEVFLYRSDSRYKLLETPLELEVTSLDDNVTVQFFVRARAVPEDAFGVNLTGRRACSFTDAACTSPEFTLPDGPITISLHVVDSGGPTLVCSVSDSVPGSVPIQLEGCPTLMSSSNSLDVTIAVIGAGSLIETGTAKISRIGPPLP